MMNRSKNQTRPKSKINVPVQKKNPSQSRSKLNVPRLNLKLAAVQQVLDKKEPLIITAQMKDPVIATNGSWVNAEVITPDPAWVNLSPAQYVWGQNDPFDSAAVVAQTFFLQRAIRTATLQFSVDNFGIVLINGVPVILDSPEETATNFTVGRTRDVRQFLRRGRNDIVLAGFNFPPGALRSPSNPAGMAALLRIT